MSQVSMDQLDHVDSIEDPTITTDVTVFEPEKSDSTVVSPTTDQALEPIQSQPQSQSQSKQEEEKAELTPACDNKTTTGSINFLSNMYNIPMVQDTVNHVRNIAEQNKFTASLLNYSESAGKYVKSKSHLLKPVEKPLKAVDSMASKSLERFERACPLVTKPTPEVVATVQQHFQAAEQNYPLLGKTVRATYSTMTKVVDKAEKVVDYMLPPAADEQSTDGLSTDDLSTDQESPAPTQIDHIEPTSENTEDQSSSSELPVARATTLAFHVIPSRLYSLFRSQAESLREVAHHSMETVHIAMETVNKKSQETSAVLIDSAKKQAHQASVQTRTMVERTVNTLSSYVPHRLQPYFESTRGILTSKYIQFRNEIQNKDESTQEKFVNIVRIGGEKVPLLEPITNRFYEKAVTELHQAN